MARKRKSTGTGAALEAPLPAEVTVPAGVANPLELRHLDQAAIAGFSADRDAFLAHDLPQGALASGVLPETVEDFFARDPFSADYANFLKEMSRQRSGRRAKSAPEVNLSLRANLLERPYLMERPEEGALRGSAAVWRSLKDQLRQESEKLIDTSDVHDLLALERDLRGRKSLITSVVRGIDMLLKRLQQRLEAEGAAAEGPAAEPPQPAVRPAKPPQS
jgi:hypothetical protein